MRQSTRSASLLLILAISISAATSPASRSHSLSRALLPQETGSELTRLTALLKSSNEEDRFSAVAGLSALDSSGTTQALITACGDRSDRLRALAVTGLGMVGDARAVAAIASLLTADKKPFVRKSAAYALARFHTGEATTALTSALTDKDPEVRSAAAATLALNPDPSSIPALIKTLDDKSEFVRARAAEALGKNSRDAAPAVPSLIRLLTRDKEHEVKRQAATALGYIGDPAAIPSLNPIVHSSDPYLAQAAIEAIHMIEEAARRPVR